MPTHSQSSSVKRPGLVADYKTMVQIPVLHEVDAVTNSPQGRGKPILQLKELEPDWERYNAWRASLVKSYSQWLKRRREFRLDDPMQD